MDIRLKFVQSVQAVLAKAGRGGSLPGAIALKLDRHFLEKFDMPETVILVTGTNGKTTTQNLIADSLRQAGLSVINNHRGDNLNIGIASLLAKGSDSSFHVKADAAVIEVDELTVYRQFKNLHPTMLVVTNFFRDQLDRAGEMETIIRKIQEVTEDFEGDLILNGDDPNVQRIAESAKKARVHFFSVDRQSSSRTVTDEASEGKFCPRCGRRLVYDYYQYSHIGRFHCECGFGEIEPETLIRGIDYDNQTFLCGGKEYRNFLNTIYSAYNCAADLCTLKTLGIDPENGDKTFRTLVLNEGRNEIFRLSRPCVINLIKNPTGSNETMKFIVSQPGPKNICILLNDNDQDGHDVSWIWDAHFERLNVPEVQTIVCSGLRAYDMALRLKYEGLEDRLIVIEDPKEAVRWLDEANLESHIMATYTALHSTRAILRKESEEHGA